VTPHSDPHNHVKFFVPGMVDGEEAEEFHSALSMCCKYFAGAPVTPARVYALRYRRDGREFLAQVGVPHPPDTDARLVMAILPSPRYFLICRRGGTGKTLPPFVVDRDEVSDAEYFNQVEDAVPQFACPPATEPGD